MSEPSVHSYSSSQEQQFPLQLTSWEQVERALEATKNGEAPTLFQIVDLFGSSGSDEETEVDNNMVYTVQRDEDDGKVYLLGHFDVDFDYNPEGNIISSEWLREIVQDGEGFTILDLDEYANYTSGPGFLFIVLGPVADFGDDKDDVDENNGNQLVLRI